MSILMLGLGYFLSFLQPFQWLRITILYVYLRFKPRKHFAPWVTFILKTSLIFMFLVLFFILFKKFQFINVTLCNLQLRLIDSIWGLFHSPKRQWGSKWLNIGRRFREPEAIAPVDSLHPRISNLCSSLDDKVTVCCFRRSHFLVLYTTLRWFAGTGCGWLWLCVQIHHHYPFEKY